MCEQDTIDDTTRYASCYGFEWQFAYCFCLSLYDHNHRVYSVHKSYIECLYDHDHRPYFMHKSESLYFRDIANITHDIITTCLI